MSLFKRKKKELSIYLKELSRNPRFLLIRNGLLGDTVFITPVLNRLYKQYPGAEISVVISESSKDILMNFPGIRHKHLLPLQYPLFKQVLFFLKLRKYKVDVVFVHEVNSHYTLMAELTGGKYLVGFRNKLDRFLDLVYDRKGPAAEAEQTTVKDITNSGIEQTILFVSEEEEQEAANILRNHGISIDDTLIFFQITCSEKNSVRQWLPERFSRLGDLLTQNLGAKIVFIGTSSDSSEIEAIRSKMRSESVSLAGKTNVRQLISIIKQGSVVIGPDTGTLHIANAVGVPVLMLMGYADPKDTGPFDLSSSSRVLHAEIECFPCKFKDPKPAQWDYCSKNRPALCMKLIEVEEVFKAAVEILNRIKKERIQ